MKIKFIALCMLAGSLQALAKVSSPSCPIKKIEEIYQNKSGFGIGSKEEQIIRNCGGAPTYGEITPAAVKTLLENPRLKFGPKERFYDLGSGVGKMVIQIAAAGTPSVGIELSLKRHQLALEGLQEAVKQNIVKKDMVRLRNENIINASIGDATIVYMASTCFSDELMQTMMKRLANLKPGLRVLTLRELPKNSKELGFEHIETLSVPMTWSSNVSLYCYLLLPK